MVLGSFGNVLVNKSRHYLLTILLGLLSGQYITINDLIIIYVLDNALTQFGEHLVFDQCFKQTLFVNYFTVIISVSNGNGTVNKSRQYVLAILIGLLRYHHITNH